VNSHLERRTAFPRKGIVNSDQASKCRGARLPRRSSRRQKNGGERGIRTLERDFSRYSLSRRAPSADSAISPQTEYPAYTAGYHAMSISGRDLSCTMAEGVGFEPTVPFGTTVFKTASLNRSDIPPSAWEVNTSENTFRSQKNNYSSTIWSRIARIVSA
jgi:hypothetical protein